MLPLVNRSRPTKIRHLVWLLAAAAVAGALPTLRGESALGQKVPLASGIPGQQDGNSPQKHEKKSDREMLQGTWTRISTEMSGQTQPIEPGKVPDLVIEGDTFAFGGVNENGELLSPEKFKLNPEASPKQIDLTPISSKAGPLKGVTYFGIYKLEDDKLTLCLNIRRNGERPQKFSSVADALPVLDVYKRKKSPDQPKPR